VRIEKLSVGWIARDAWLIIGARSAHGFAQGFLAVVLAIYLAKIGFTLPQIGAYFSLGFAGSAILSFAASIISERVGRRLLLLVFTGLTTIAGASLIFTEQMLPLMIFAFLGSMTGSQGAVGPTQPMEQAGLAGVVDSRRRTDLFATYRIISNAATALGALAAGAPVILQRLDVGEIASFKLTFAVLIAFRLITAIFFIMLSARVESAAAERRWTNPLTLPSRRIIFTLTGLFSIDHFGGALVIQAFLALWIYTKFGLEVGSLGLVFFVSQLLSAVSLWASAKIANRIGLINTMVFTHIPSNLFLILAVFAPDIWMVIALLQLRAFFSQMDVAPRDSYIMSVVTPEERVAMAGIHIVGRSLAGTAAPSIATALWTTVAVSAPLIASGVIKIGYDLALFYMFRNVKPSEEGEATQAPSSP
jgi:MFS family permease